MSKVMEEMNKVRGERTDSYGAPEDSFQLIGDLWTTYLNGNKPECIHTYISPKDVAMMLCLLKVARTVGGKDKLDNYVDLANYAVIAGDMMDNK